MTDGGQDFDLGQVVGSAGEKGDDGSTVWNTSTAPTYANSKYTFTISNLSGKTGLTIAVNDIIFYSTYYYIVSAVNSTTVDCTTRVSIKGSDASVTIVDNLTSTSTSSALSAKQGKVLNDNKLAIAQTSYKGKNVVVDSTTGNITFENKPTIPTKVSDLSNDSGFITSSSLPTKTSDLTNDGSSSSDSLVYVETSATNGLLKSDGTVDTSTYLTEMKIGSTANLPVITGTSGALTTGSFGTSANTFCQGNDSRLSDSRTPTSHTHGQITNDGKITSTAVTVASGDNIVITDYSDSSKVKRVANLLAGHIKDGTAHTNIGSSASATQATINTNIDTALGNKVNTSDIADNLTTNDATKVLSAKQGKILNDLIGSAITYIVGSGS